MPGSNAATEIQSAEISGITASRQSRVGLNAANFFLAEVTGVVLPFLNDFLRGRGWHYDSIGLATATAGLGVFLMQAPAGFLVDRIPHRRVMLAAASLLLGTCYGLLPLVQTDWRIVDPLLFIAGAGQAFFTPLLGALALGLVGHAQLNKTMGMNQGWNHLGNMAAAVTAMVLVTWISLASVFYAVAAVAALAAISVFAIRPEELDEKRASGATQDDGRESIGFWGLLQDRRVLVLFASTALFHLANAPVMPLVALYLKHLQGSDMQVAAVVLVAQLVMVPVALMTGWLCDRWGRKPVFAIGFIVLPLRIFLYSLASTPGMLVALQTLDGIGAGIYGVAIVAMCADLTRGKGGFNTLCGMIATALCLGGVIGPLSSGFLVEHLGFIIAFYFFAGVAAVAAALFLFFMPETRPSETNRLPLASLTSRGGSHA